METKNLLQIIFRNGKFTADHIYYAIFFTLCGQTGSENKQR
jgi:hypothetical protein